MRQLYNALAALALSLATACGSGNDNGDQADAGPGPISDAGDAGDAASGPDAMPTAAPTGAFVFPPRRALTDQSSLRVRGTADDDIAVAGVRINGQSATSVDGFATWQVTIPLTVGVNTLTLEVEDITGNITAAADEVEVVVSQAVLDVPRDLALDDSTRTLYVADESQDAIIAIDMVTGVHTVVSNASTGAGPTFGLLRAIDLDLASGRALVVDGELDAVFAVDLMTGDRSYLTSSTVGSGPTVLNGRSIIVDAPQGRALVADSSRDALMTIDLANGDRSIISAPGAGAGVDLVAPRGMALDNAQNRVLLMDSSLDALLAIDLATGDRTILSDDATGDGYRFTAPSSVVLAPTPGFALVVERDLRGLLLVNLATGDRQLISSGVFDLGKSYVGSGPLFGAPEAMVMDPTTGAALVLDGFRDLVISADPVTGRRAFLWGDTAHNPSALVIDSNKTRLVAVDGNRSGVVATDLATGAATVIADDDIGVGPDVIEPRDAVLDEAGDRLYFTDSVDFDDNDWYSALTSVDLTTGDRAHVAETGSFPYLGDGPAMQRVAGLIARSSGFLATHNADREFCDVAGIMDIAAATGDRTFVSQTNDCGDPVLGAGPAFGLLTALTEDSNPTHVLVADYSASAIWRVQLATGDREVVADPAVGAGPVLGRVAGMKIDELDPTRIVVVDSTLDALLSVDLATGDRTVLSDAGVGNGPVFQSPTSLVFDRDPSIVLVGEGFARGILGGVYMVDRQTGERVIVWQ